MTDKKDKKPAISIRYTAEGHELVCRDVDEATESEAQKLIDDGILDAGKIRDKVNIS